MITNPCLMHFIHKHKTDIGAPYDVKFGKDNSIMKQLIELYGVEKLNRLIDRFFVEVRIDPFLQSTGASVGVFRTQIPKLLLKADVQQKQSKRGTW